MKSDVFISYAHLDNRPLTPEQEGWVTRFHSALEGVLAMRLGREPTIWRDPKLKGCDVFSDEILSRLKESALFIGVVSPRYVLSKWCQKEVESFHEAVAQHARAAHGNRSNLFKLIKTPVDDETALPAPMQSVLGYAFFTEADGDAPLEFDPIYGEESGQAFYRKVALMAYHIAELLKDTSTDDTSEKQKVYLAECAHDRVLDRDLITSELEMAGYHVLPTKPLPRDEKAYVAEVTALLEQSVLSIHLVGAALGSVPDGPSEESGVMAQNRIAATLSRDRGLRRVISLPAGTASRNGSQQEFLERLVRDEQLQLGAEVVAGDLEAVKRTVRAQLERVGERDATEFSSTDGLKEVYVLCTERDRQAAMPLLKYLKDAGCKPRLPVFTGDAASVRRAHEELLQRCLAALVYYGEGDEAWCFHAKADLTKARALRDKDFRVRCTYLAMPGSDDKQVLLGLGQDEPLGQSPDAVIDGTKGLNTAGLDAFMRAMEPEA